MVQNSFDPLIWPGHFDCIVGQVSCKSEFPKILQIFVQFLAQDHPANRQSPINIYISAVRRSENLGGHT